MQGLILFSGGSACKVVYVHKDDWIEPDKRKTVCSYCMDIQNQCHVFFGKNGIFANDNAIQVLYIYSYS